MGCWNGTCMISNLPILSGNKIKLVILKSNVSFNEIKPLSGYTYTTDIFTPSFQQAYFSYLNSSVNIANLFDSSSVADLSALDFAKAEFQRLDSLDPGEVERSMGHIYTAGEHSRNVLRALDEISSFKEGDL